MTRPRVLRAIAAACVLAAGILVSPLFAGADEPAEIGWWSRENGGNPVGPPITVPRPPDVPEGGLLVAQDFAGPSAISALRFRVAVETSSTLTLAVAESLPPLNPPQIAACLPASGWGAIDHGEWFTAPDTDCGAGEVLGEVGEGTITWSLPPAFKREGRPYVEVVLIPAPDDPTPFRVPFAAPGAGALTAPVDLTGPTTTSFDPAPAVVAPAPPVEQPERTFGGAGVVAAATPPPPTTTTAPAAQATPPPQDEVAGGPVTPVGATDTTGQRVLAAALLGVLGIILFTASTERERMAALLARVPAVGGRMGGSAGGDSERVGGVGRFSRARDDLPTRL